MEKCPKYRDKQQLKSWKLTQFSNFDKGVIQGNPPSPLLFNVYINDLFKQIEEANDTLVTLDGRNNISTLMFADDLIIFSKPKRGLHSSLNALHTYSKMWDLEVNTKKQNACHFQQEIKKNTVNTHLITKRYSL